MFCKQITWKAIAFLNKTTKHREAWYGKRCYKIASTFTSNEKP
ncbi:MAG TPA: hypothetical protein V6D43_07135 [Candidatus Sericytochromatia bacterium]|jgi:hypothetical protein